MLPLRPVTQQKQREVGPALLRVHLGKTVFQDLNGFVDLLIAHVDH